MSPVNARGAVYNSTSGTGRTFGKGAIAKFE